MTRNMLRTTLFAFLIVFGSSIALYSVASANDAGPVVADVVVAPVDEAPVPTAEPVPAEPVVPVVVAPEPAKVQSPAVARLIDMLLDILSVVLLILVPYFVHRGLAYFEKKTSLELSPYMTNKLNDLLDKGLAYAEEQAHKVLKKNEKSLTMSEKLEHGAGYVMDLADAADAKTWTTEKVKKMLEARLNEKRGGDVKIDGNPGVTLDDPDTETVPA
jgi:hypothetical protein